METIRQAAIWLRLSQACQINQGPSKELVICCGIETETNTRCANPDSKKTSCTVDDRKWDHVSKSFERPSFVSDTCCTTL